MSRFGSEGEDIIGKWSEEKLDLPIVRTGLFYQRSVLEQALVVRM
jgi:hypothetical protein